MAAIDYNAQLIAAITAAALAAPTVGQVLAAKPGNVLPETRPGARQRGAHKGLPADFLELRVESRTDREAKTVTPTFGQGRDPNADAIVPVRATFDVVLTYDPVRWAQMHPGAALPEVELRGAMHVNYPKLGGLNYVAGFEIERTRGGSRAPAAASKTVIDRVTFDLRLHAAQLRN